MENTDISRYLKRPLGLSPKDAGRVVAEQMLADITATHLTEGGSKAFLDAKAKLKAVGMHIHDTGWGDYRVVHSALKKKP